MNISIKKAVIIGVLVLIAGAVGATSWGAPQAQANGFTDFFHNLLSPFSPHPNANSSSTSSSENVPLYKPVIDYEAAVVSAVKKASPAVVSITISENVPVLENCPINPFGNLPPDMQQLFGDSFPGGITGQCATGKTQLQKVGGGSGFIISSDGLILTNKHVVSETKASYSVLTNDGKTYPAKVLARDPNQDLAVVKIDATGLPTVTLGDSGALELGQTAIAIGNALGQFSNTVSVGVISGLSRTVTATGPGGVDETIQGVLQTDAAINPGNSGGPLLNLQGEVIGIDTAIASDAQNIGFAIPINRAKRDISSVETTGVIQTPYLGVRYISVTPDLAKQQGLSVDYGALARGNDQGPAVQPKSPADNAGIKAEDIILSVNGQKLDADHNLGDIIIEHNVGDVITLVIDRGGKQITLQATLEKRPSGQ